MPKWVLFGLAAAVDLLFAIITYRSGRLVFPVILGIACVFFVIAAVGSARTKASL